MNIFKRILKVGQAELHSAINQLEDPIKMTEQGIRDMREDLEESVRGLAEVKAMAIRSRNNAEKHASKAADYENKAVQLLQRSYKGDLAPTEADRLAGEALQKKEEYLKLMATAKDEQQQFEKSVHELEASVKELRATISKWENELKTLKSRVTVSNATKSINKQLAQIDSSSTVTLLERMKEKVAVEEALAASYGEITQESRYVDKEIDKALLITEDTKTANDVSALKVKLGMTQAGTSE